MAKDTVKGAAFVKGTAFAKAEKGSVSLAAGGSVTLHLDRTTAHNLLSALTQAMEPGSGALKGPKPKGFVLTEAKGAPKAALEAVPKIALEAAPKGAPKGTPKVALEAAPKGTPKSTPKSAPKYK